MKCNIIIYLVFITLFGSSLIIPGYGFNLEGTTTYPNYLFVLVHGINSRADIFEGKDGFGNLREYLENTLKLKGYVYCYTFSNPNDSNDIAAKEFGDRSYDNKATYRDESGNLRNMGGKCWLEKARDDFIKNNPGKKIPSKFIVIAHSMGNLAVRSYIYSDAIYGAGKGFYQEDVSKVVFIAPPFDGSDMTLATWKYWGDISFKGWDVIQNGVNVDIAGAIQGLINFNGDPYIIYRVAGAVVATDIYGEQVLTSKFGLDTLKPWWGGMIDLLPMSDVVNKLKGAKLSDSALEPAYSIIYGKGIPVYDYASSLSFAGMKWLNEEEAKKAFAEASASRGTDYVDSSGRIYSNFISQFLSIDYQYLTLLHPKFSELSTSQAKFMSFLQAAVVGGFFVQDGDGLVPTYSAKGEDVEHLKNAKRYEHVFKTQPVEDYFSNNFMVELAATEASIYILASLTQQPSQSFWFLRLPLALHIVSVVVENAHNLREDLKAHGHILEQYALITTAILDTPAVFTLNDLQAVATGEGQGVGSQEVLKTFSISNPEKGYQSIKVKSITENRNAKNGVNMPIPTTIDNNRAYMTEILVTTPPERLIGKLNYLIPAKMKNFEYSFNFAAWKPIENVDPKTGEFIIDGLKFAEGQNVIAIRSENAVGIKNHQLLKVTVNSIPMFSSGMFPLPSSYINNARPEIVASFSKAVFSEDTEQEDIEIESFKLDGEDVVPIIEKQIGTNKATTIVRYRSPKPLNEGEHTVVMTAKSNVGVSQARWSFNVDTIAPSIKINPIKPFSPHYN